MIPQRLLPFLALPLFLLTFVSPAKVEAKPLSSTSNYQLPSLLSLGAGYFDVNKNNPRRDAIDFRLEYRSGMSLLPMIFSDLKSWDKWFQIHPMAGIETSSRSQFYANAGFVFDVLLGDHVVLSPNVVVGLYERGHGKRLGSFVEFRSTLEAGYRFDNEVRLTGFFGHISNAGLTSLNPGAEVAGGYIHIPLNLMGI